MDIISGMTYEFEESEGMVDCEFSFHCSKMSELYEQFKVANASMRFGYWQFTICPTCENQHGPGFMHAQIVRN